RSPGRSAAVTTSRTPGTSSAALASMPTILPAATDERTIRAWAIRRRCTSAPNLPVPVRSRASSLRGTRRPICSVMTDPFAPLGLLDHRVDDALVPGAPAQVGRDDLARLVAVGLGLRRQVALGEHQEPRRAEAALQCVVPAERLLELAE